MKVLKLVFPFVLYGVSFYLFYTNFNDQQNLLSDTMFSSGLLIILVYSVQFIRKGGYGFGGIGFGRNAINQANIHGASHALNETNRLNNHVEKVTKSEGYEDYINSKKSHGFPPTFLALPFGFISIIISLFV